MKPVLEPLVRIPGVRLAAVISEDGVPIALLKGADRAGTFDESGDVVADAEELHAFAALAAGWLGDAERAVAPLSWQAPTRVVLRATRGALILQRGPGAVLLAVLDHGAVPEELRVPMDGAIARMHRMLRTMGGAETRPAIAEEATQPPGILPARPQPATDRPEHIEDHFSEISGDR